MIDKRFYPKLGDTIEVCLEVLGYRLEPGITATSLGREIFRCDASGLTKRFSGQTGVSSAEMSMLVARLGLDAEGIFPEDLACESEDLRTRMKDQHIGLYGRGASVRLYRAVSEFKSGFASVEIRLEQKRASAFTAFPEKTRGAGSRFLRPGQAVRFICEGPVASKLLLLDHQADGAGATVLSPCEPDLWARPDTGATYYIPDRIDPPLLVTPQEGNRHISALWVDSAVADIVVSTTKLQFDPHLRQKDDPPEFREMAAHEVARIVDALQQKVDCPINAAATLSYRVDAM